MVLLSPAFSVFDGSELLGLGAALPGAVPGGVLVVGLMPLDEFDGIDEEDEDEGIDDDEDGLIVEEDGVFDELPELMLPELDGDGDVDDVEELGIVVLSVVGVAGGSLFLHAPSVTKVAATATHVIEPRIELRIFSLLGDGTSPEVARAAIAIGSAIDRTRCRPNPKARRDLSMPRFQATRKSRISPLMRSGCSCTTQCEPSGIRTTRRSGQTRSRSSTRPVVSARSVSPQITRTGMRVVHAEGSGTGRAGSPTVGGCSGVAR